MEQVQHLVLLLQPVAVAVAAMTVLDPVADQVADLALDRLEELEPLGKDLMAGWIM
jgi:hypothetical protein